MNCKWNTYTTKLSESLQCLHNVVHVVCTYRNNAMFLAAGIILIKGCLKQWGIVIHCASRWHKSGGPCGSCPSYQTVFQPSSSRSRMTSSGCNSSWIKLWAAASLDFHVVISHSSSASGKLFTQADHSWHFQVSGSSNNVFNGVRIEVEDSSVDELEHNLKSGHTDSIELNVPRAVVRCGKHECVEFCTRRSENAAVCTEAAVITDVNNDITERFKVSLGIELFQQLHTMAPEQCCVLCAKTAPFHLILTITANIHNIHLSNPLNLLIKLHCFYNIHHCLSVSKCDQ